MSKFCYERLSLTKPVEIQAIQYITEKKPAKRSTKSMNDSIKNSQTQEKIIDCRFSDVDLTLDHISLGFEVREIK